MTPPLLTTTSSPRLWRWALALCLLPVLAAGAERPGAYAGLEREARLALPRAAVRLTGTQLRLPGPAGETLSFDLERRHLHRNGDQSLEATAPDGARIDLTLGRAGAFGRLYREGRAYLLHSDASGTWLITLPESGVTYNACGLHAAPTKTGMRRPAAGGAEGAAPAAAHGDAPATVLDILIGYNRAFAERYPGDLLETRINHLVHIGNQALANSDIDLGLRVVGREFFDYRNDNTNLELRDQMIAVLGGGVAPGLAGLRELRDALGADLVIMLRPHDIETRGSCGIAAFPQDDDPKYGVNVVSDGMSSWSLCLDDVLIHEIGHNLGAGHQAGAGGGFFDPRGSALSVPGQFTTVMGSFGTGRPDRFRGLPVFSNPEVRCGGRACGSSDPAALADNAAVIRSVMTAVAGYRPASSDEPLPGGLARVQLDSDADGVSDWEDHFPFEGSEFADSDLDGAGDSEDLFPADPGEQADSDGDGLGDRSDPDDDNDGVPDVDDAFALDPAESADTDRDGTGDAADAFPANANESADSDGDGLGDHADDDDDNDGYPELDGAGQDVLVVSVGNSRVLRFDAASGASRGVEITAADGLFTFQSDLALRASDQVLLYLNDSSVKRLDLLSRETLGIWVPPYDDLHPGRPQLGTGFPTGLAAFNRGTWLGVSLMRTEQPRVYAGQGVARNEPVLAWNLPEGESPIDIVANGDGVIILGQSERALYGADRLGVRTLSGPASAWMVDPHRMALAPDGRLLVSDQGLNAVVAVDSASGAFLGELADLGAVGYSNPTGVAVTDQGDLLVASADHDAILRFDADSGAFLGELVAPGASGLDQPHAMVLVPRLLDRFARDPQRVLRPNAGLWSNPDTNGRGFDIEVFGHLISAIWYTYDAQGLPTWYLSAGPLEGFEFEQPLQRLRLGADGVPEIEDVGMLYLWFDSERLARMEWSIGEQSGGETLQWFEFDPDPAAEDHTGLWGRADGPGWGISLASQGRETVAIAYIYDAAGEPRWIISDPLEGPGPLRFEMNAVFSDTLCPGCTGVPEFQIRAAGVMELGLGPERYWSSAVVLPPPATGGWDLDRTPIIRFSEAPTRPR